MRTRLAHLLSVLTVLTVLCLFCSGCRYGQQTPITNYGTLTYSMTFDKSPVSNSKETPFDVMRGVLQGAEVPIAAGATPNASLTSTGKTQTYDNGTAAPVTPSAQKAVTGTPGGDGKATPGVTTPGG